MRRAKVQIKSSNINLQFQKKKKRHSKIEANIQLQQNKQSHSISNEPNRTQESYSLHQMTRNKRKFNKLKTRAFLYQQRSLGNRAKQLTYKRKIYNN